MTEVVKDSPVRFRCPVHHMPDCSPILNGCSLVVRAYKAAENGQPSEPTQLLAVVEELDWRRRRWFRWAYDSHTSAPWELMGTVHVGGEDPEATCWADLPPVRIVSEGVPTCGCSSCGGPH